MTLTDRPLEDEDPIFIRRSIRDILIVFAPALLVTDLDLCAWHRP